MSYDITLRSDDAFSLHAPLEDLRGFLLRIPGLQAGGTHDVVYEDGEKEDGLSFVVYLELVDEEGNSLDGPAGAPGPETVNCVRACVPYAFLESQRNQRRVLEVCYGIARHLGWRMYDEQEGEYIQGDFPGATFARMEASTYAARSILDSLGLGLPAPQPRPVAPRRLWVSRRLWVALLLAGVASAAIALFLWERTPPVGIHEAAAKGDLRSAVRWLELDAALASSRDAEGATPLHLSAANGHRHIVMALLGAGAGADVNAKGPGGRTPLHLAAKGGYELIAGILLGRGADPHAKDEDGKTPPDLAAQEGHAGVKALILRGGRRR